MDESEEQALVEAQKRRGEARKDVQKAQTKLSTLLAERRESTKKLDRLAKQNSTRVVNPEMLTLPSVALRGGGDEAMAEEIRSLMRENKELEEALAQNDGARLQLEKLQNDKRDAQRRIREMRQEDKLVKEQLDVKRKELEDLQTLIKPSPMRQRYEIEMERHMHPCA